jgi:hypothetical protein
VAHAAEDGHNVLLKLHPGTAAITEAPTGEGIGDLAAGEFNTGRHAFNNSDQCRTMGFTGSQPTQHTIHPAT